MASTSASFKAGVVIPAAGSGTRFGGETKKQFQVLGDRPLVVATALLFVDLPFVVDVVVVAPPDQIDDVRALFEAVGHSIRVVSGGATRSESVRNGFENLVDVDVVAVHDGVRPFVSPSKIEEVLQLAHVHGAAALAVPATDTLRKSDEGKFRDTVDRTGLWCMQTPQAFSYDILANAFSVSVENTATDEVELVCRLGVDVHLVEGEKTNIKITTEEDWALGLAIAASRK